jgi:hypothetical protein
MTSTTTMRFLIFATLVLLGGTVVSALLAGSFKGEILSSAVTLSIVGAAAVGIERVIEAFWTVIGLTKGTFWPLNKISEQVDGLVSQLNTSLGPFFERAIAETEKAAKSANKTAAEIAAIKKELTDAQTQLNAQIEEIKKLAPGSQQVQMIAAATNRSISLLKDKFPELGEVAKIALDGVNSLNTFVGTFNDNPGRRLISIFAGSFIGLVVATAMRLDLFHAAWDAPKSKYMPAKFAIGVAFTGLVMGLGATPTHEIIKSIQEFKKSLNAPPPPTA